MIRTKGEAGTGDVVHAVQHMRKITLEMRQLTVLTDQELYAAAKELQAPYELVRMVAKAGKLPVPNFSAGGIATPAYALRQGASHLVVGRPITQAADPAQAAEAILREMAQALTAEPAGPAQPSLVP